MGNVFWGRQYHCEVCFDIDSMGAQLFAGFGPPCMAFTQKGEGSSPLGVT